MPLPSTSTRPSLVLPVVTVPAVLLAAAAGAPDAEVFEDFEPPYELPLAHAVNAIAPRAVAATMWVRRMGGLLSRAWIGTSSVGTPGAGDRFAVAAADPSR